ARLVPSCPRSCASVPSRRTGGSCCSSRIRRRSSVLGSPDADREFLIRSCGILLHGDSVLAQEGRIADGVSYALPGGHVEFGETLAACVSREILEETGLNVEPEKMVYVHENFYTLKRVRTHEVGF